MILSEDGLKNLFNQLHFSCWMHIDGVFELPSLVPCLFKKKRKAVLWDYMDSLLNACTICFLMCPLAVIFSFLWLFLFFYFVKAMMGIHFYFFIFFV
jgi:hypothetical protein